MIRRICACTFALLLLNSFAAFGQRVVKISARGDSIVADTLRKEPAKQRSWKLSVGTDLAGAILAAATSYGSYEGNLRVNLRETWFPVLEVGLGVSNHTNEDTHIHYKTRSPYFRLGCDYNFIKDKTSGNRIFGGVRYGFSPFTYDVSGPALYDNVYKTYHDFNYTGLSATSHWAEFVGGIEAKVWGILHLGWSVRYKLRIAESKTTVGHAWYIPGYGTSDGSVMTGTFNVSIDI